MIGMKLADQVAATSPDMIDCDSETCRWNIEKMTGIKTVHLIHLIGRSMGV